MKFDICIPKVDKSVTQSQIYTVFSKLNIGKIGKILIIDSFPNNLNSSKIIFITFTQMHDNNRSTFIQNRLNNGNDIKIVYNNKLPWFWKICLKHKKNLKG